jgi:Domain of unknown function (DUF4349)
LVEDMTTIRTMWLLLIALLLAAVGCGGAYPMAGSKDSAMRATRSDGVHEEADMGMFASGDMPAQEPAPRYAEVTTGPESPPPPPAPAPAKPDASSPPNVKKQAQPLLIYTADYTMAVFESTAAIDQVQKLAEELGGYLVRRDDRSIIVRVPSNTFKNALSKIGTFGDVLHREESVEDVTEAFYDLKTRLDNARALRARLEQLLAQANDVKEALAVEKELARVTTEIETMEGKLKRLRELIAFSTITVRFEARGGDHVNDEVRLPFPWLDQLGLSNLLNL